MPADKRQLPLVLNPKSEKLGTDSSKKPQISKINLAHFLPVTINN